MTDDRRLIFAVLAACGAYFCAYGIASGIGLELWSGGLLGVPAGPPRLEPTLAVGTFAGGFVAWRLAGWRGALAFAVIGIIGALRHLISVIQCATGDLATCEGMKDLDFVIPQLWLIPGLVLGMAAAHFMPVRVPLRTELEALGIFALALPVRFVLVSLPIYLPFFQGADGQFMYWDEFLAIDVALVVAAALLAAVFLRRRSTRPMHSALLVAAVFVVLGLLRLDYVLRYSGGLETLQFIAQVSDFIAAALILIIAGLTRSQDHATRIAS